MFIARRFGLSYATFTFGDKLSLSAVEITADDTFTAELQISSRGPAGQTVIQIYASHPPTTGGVRYQYTLLCFSKLLVPADSAGATATVKCEASDLEVYDTNGGEYLVPTGNYNLFAAQHAGELPTRTTARFQLVDADRG
jgi:hypothetical protein